MNEYTPGSVQFTDEQRQELKRLNKLNVQYGSAIVGLSSVSIPHSLGQIPSFVTITMRGAGHIYIVEKTNTTIVLKADVEHLPCYWKVEY